MGNPSERCAEIRAALPLFVGGDLEAEEIADVAAHLGRCPGCAEVEALARTARGGLSVLAELEARRPVPALWDGVRRRLEQEGILGPVSRVPMKLAVRTSAAAATPAAAAAVRPRPSGVVRRLWIGSAAAAAAVVFAFGVASTFGPSGSISPSTTGPGAIAGAGDAAAERIDGGNTPTPTTPAVDLLRHVGETGTPLWTHAVEIVPEQGIVVRRPAGQPALVGGHSRHVAPERMNTERMDTEREQ